MTETITIRPATSQDRDALRRLAELDRQAPIADPFRATLGLIALLRDHANGTRLTKCRRLRARRQLRLRTS